ncbi:hypothetical protein [Vibrio mediterranei]|uniref:hypothetical protein n=1 Tax=Vibrio mediterranei TaxID=689 RepID=UPI001EFEEB1E|nr:hypothetical protein [Vibrio mediterranei]MCG9657612.1 hypothetical protein [Vibrio mediterranei]
MVTTRSRIGIATQHGGSWYHIRIALINEGASNSFADYFVGFMKSTLNSKHSERCKYIYDVFVDYGECAAKMAILLLK